VLNVSDTAKTRLIAAGFGLKQKSIVRTRTGGRITDRARGAGRGRGGALRVRRPYVLVRRRLRRRKNVEALCGPDAAGDGTRLGDRRQKKKPRISRLAKRWQRSMPWRLKSGMPEADARLLMAGRTIRETPVGVISFSCGSDGVGTPVSIRSAGDQRDRRRRAEGRLPAMGRS